MTIFSIGNYEEISMSEVTDRENQRLYDGRGRHTKVLPLDNLSAIKASYEVQSEDGLISKEEMKKYGMHLITEKDLKEERKEENRFLRLENKI